MRVLSFEDNTAPPSANDIVQDIVEVVSDLSKPYLVFYHSQPYDEQPSLKLKTAATSTTQSEGHRVKGFSVDGRGQVRIGDKNYYGSEWGWVTILYSRRCDRLR